MISSDRGKHASEWLNTYGRTPPELEDSDYHSKLHSQRRCATKHNSDLTVLDGADPDAQNGSTFEHKGETQGNELSADRAKELPLEHII